MFFDCATMHDNPQKLKEIEEKYKKQPEKKTVWDKVADAVFAPFSTNAAAADEWHAAPVEKSYIQPDYSKRSRIQQDKRPEAVARNNARKIKLSRERSDPTRDWEQEKADMTAHLSRVNAERKFGKTELHPAYKPKKYDPKKYNEYLNSLTPEQKANLQKSRERTDLMGDWATEQGAIKKAYDEKVFNTAANNFALMNTEYTPVGNRSESFVSGLRYEKTNEQMQNATQNLYNVFQEYFTPKEMADIIADGDITIIKEKMLASLPYNEATKALSDIDFALLYFYESFGPLMNLERDFVYGSSANLPQTVKQELLPYLIEGKGDIPFGRFIAITFGYANNSDDLWKLYCTVKKDYQLAENGATFSKLDSETVGTEKTLETDLNKARGLY